VLPSVHRSLLPRGIDAREPGQNNHEE
jgi:hypothetical protein